MEAITDDERKGAKRAYFREYMKNYRKYNDRCLSDLVQRQKPEYRERERLRMVKRNERMRQFRMFKEAMPLFLFI
jgi:hypothetical protein